MFHHFRDEQGVGLKLSGALNGFHLLVRGNEFQKDA